VDNRWLPGGRSCELALAWGSFPRQGHSRPAPRRRDVLLAPPSGPPLIIYLPLFPSDHWQPTDPNLLGVWRPIGGSAHLRVGRPANVCVEWVTAPLPWGPMGLGFAYRIGVGATRNPKVDCVNMETQRSAAESWGRPPADLRFSPFPRPHTQRDTASMRKWGGMEPLGTCPGGCPLFRHSGSTLTQARDR